MESFGVAMNNTTDGHIYHVPNEFLSNFDILFVVCVVIAIVVGVIANGTVIGVVFKMRERRTVSSVYVASLAITDLIFLVLCAGSTAYICFMTTWTLGDFMCRFIGYMQYVSMLVVYFKLNNRANLCFWSFVTLKT